MPEGLKSLAPLGLTFKNLETTYFLGRETIVPSKASAMSKMGGQLFAVLARNERTASSFFCLPPNRVVELGAQIQL